MHDTSDTIFAVSSPTSDCRVIIRVSGPEALGLVRSTAEFDFDGRAPRLCSGRLKVCRGLEPAAYIYIFTSPDSYTGQDLVEIHTDCGESATQKVLHRLAAAGGRTAAPGEFTARRYLAGKIDLACAEAVAEVVASTNRLALAAAERLLVGKVSLQTTHVGSRILDVLATLEAGLDFDQDQVGDGSGLPEKIGAIKADLTDLVECGVRCETLMDLRTVVLAGAVNAGKSSLANTLLGMDRSIVSGDGGTTRDVLTGVLELEHNRCLLSDTAGLIGGKRDVLDELAMAATITAAAAAAVIVLCVDMSAGDIDQSITLAKLLPRPPELAIATKADLAEPARLAAILAQLKRLFGLDFLQTSSTTGDGIDRLRQAIDEALGGARCAAAGCDRPDSTVALTARHHRQLKQAIESLAQARRHIEQGSHEVAALFLREAHQHISDLDRPAVDEKILDEIFSRFCIGK